MLISGVLDRARLVSNILLILLLAGNLYFSVQFIYNLQNPVPTNTVDQTKVTAQIKSAHFLKSFIDKVLNTTGGVSLEDRVQLENDILQIHDPALTLGWNKFVESKTSKDAQSNAVKLMVLLIDRVNLIQ